VTSIFWYDYETTGINPRNDRPLQVAGIRTDHELNEIDAPVNLYCQPSEDILPHPAACAITGITPSQLAEKGLSEADFMTRVHAQLAAPGTCGAGYNTLRFDDEMTRYSLYRNFFDPYAREWQGGNSRWDLIDVVRAAYALRPDGLVWPTDDEGRVTLKLERLTAANNIDHGHAHEALSDVRATIALARLIRENSRSSMTGCFNCAANRRSWIRFACCSRWCIFPGASRRHAVMSAWSCRWPGTRKSQCVDCLRLAPRPAGLLDLDAQTLRQRLYTRRDDLLEGELPVPLKLIHINRCPVVAPLSVLRAVDQQRLGLDMALYQARALRLTDAQQVWKDKVAAIMPAKISPQRRSGTTVVRRIYR
jgi:exodeoxyribonuclease-1